MLKGVQVVGVQKRQVVLLMLYLGKLNINTANEIGLSKNELLQTIYKLKKDGYKIEFDKNTYSYYLTDKNKPLVFDVKITEKVSDKMAKGIILGRIPVLVKLNKTKLNGSPFIRIKCKAEINDNMLILSEY